MKVVGASSQLQNTATSMAHESNGFVTCPRATGASKTVSSTNPSLPPPKSMVPLNINAHVPPASTNRAATAIGVPDESAPATFLRWHRQATLFGDRANPGPVAGLIGLTASDIEIQDALGTSRWEYEGEWIPHPVVRLSTTLPIAVNRDDERVVTRARWGFPGGGGRAIGNARDDRLLESRMWLSFLGKSHGLVASTGIYEMIREPAKQAFWFRRRDQKPIVMPALVGSRNLKGESRLCCAIITTQPNDFFSRYHNRQVCALTSSEADAWMAATDPEDAKAVLHAPASDEWEAVPVEDRIFRPGRVELEHLVESGPVERA